MEGWEVKTLGEVYDVRDGTHDSPKYLDSGRALITSKNLKPEGLDFENVKFISEVDYQSISKRSAVSKGDVLFAMIGTIGNPTLVDLEPDFAIKNVALFKVPESQNSKFLQYYLLTDSVKKKMENEARGTTQKFVGLGYLRNFPVLSPSLSTQQRIVAILDEAFAAIDRARANVERNKANARELFDSYLNAIFSNPSVDWEEKSLLEVCTINSNLVAPQDPEYIDLPHIGAGNMVSKTGEMVDIKTAREEGLISGKFVFDEKMVLYSKIRPYLMKVCRPNFIGLCSADVYPLMSNALLDRDFFFYLLLSQDFTNYAIAGSARAGMPKVNREHLFAYRLSLPKLSQQKQFAIKLDDLSSQAKTLEANYQKKLNALDELKQSLLYQAFSGQLTKTPDKALEAISA